MAAEEKTEQKKGSEEGGGNGGGGGLPEPQTTPLEGKTTLDEDVTLESAILAYDSVSRIAGEIARLLKNDNVEEVMILDPADGAGLQELRWVSARIQALQAAFDSIKPEKPATKVFVAEAITAISTATVLVKSALDLVALFRSNVDIKSSEITLEDTALVADLARQLRGHARVFYPRILPFDFVSTAQDSRIMAGLESLYAAQVKAEGLTLKEQEDKARLEEASKAFQAFREDLLKGDAASGTLLARVLRAETLERKLAGEKSRLLYLKILKAGGGQQTVHKLTRLRDSLAFSGGAIVTYILFAKDGSVESSKTLYFHSGFRPFAQGDEEEVPLENFT
ncbi:MAG TPA: hypothetical protein VF789_34050 [Thermoanaerobaculia bacterium]